MEKAKTMNVHQRINEIRKKVAYLRKEKKVGEGGGYMTVTHDQVTGELRDHLIEFGVIVEPPDLVKSAMMPTGTTTAKGIPFMRYEATYRVDFVNMDEPTDRISKNIEVHAIDQGDKAPGKAMSYATKYPMLKMFNIETGEQEEDRPELKAAKITPAAGIEDVVSDKDKEIAWRIVGTVMDCLEADMPEEAVKAIAEAQLDVETKIFMWRQLDSKQRSLLKKTADNMKKTAEALKANKVAEPA